MANILIVDDHRLIREGLKEIINGESDLAVVAEAGTGREAIQVAQKCDCDIVLLDINMPEGGGLEVLKQLKSLKPDTAVLILSMHAESQYALRFLRAGAAGYITKDSAPEELITALHRVSQNRKYISNALAEELATQLDENLSEPKHSRLSDREFEIMLLIAAGKTISDIANDISLSVKTVSTYRNRALQKMNMKTNVDLTRYALQYGLIE